MSERSHDVVVVGGRNAAMCAALAAAEAGGPPLLPAKAPHGARSLRGFFAPPGLPSPLRALARVPHVVPGLIARAAHGIETIPAGAVVLASGGFEANVEMRTRYLGPNWDLARVRGTPYNTGDGIRMALEIGAQPWGHWSGCHSVQWDLNAPWHGDRKVGDNFQKHSYPVGIIVNIHGRP